MRQAQILLNSGNLLGGVSQPQGGGLRQPGQKGGSLAWLHVTEPRAPRPMSRGAGKLYHLQKAVRGGALPVIT